MCVKEENLLPLLLRSKRMKNCCNLFKRTKIKRREGEVPSEEGRTFGFQEEDHFMRGLATWLKLVT